MKIVYIYDSEEDMVDVYDATGLDEDVLEAILCLHKHHIYINSIIHQYCDLLESTEYGRKTYLNELGKPIQLSDEHNYSIVNETS